jgi:hypothetical protein
MVLGSYFDGSGDRGESLPVSVWSGMCVYWSVDHDDFKTDWKNKMC